MRTVDTDVLFLVISTVTNLEDTEILVAFGTGKNFRCIPAYEFAKQLIIEKKHVHIPCFIHSRDVTLFRSLLVAKQDFIRHMKVF